MPEALDRIDSPGLVRPLNSTPANGYRPGPACQIIGGFRGYVPTTAGPDAGSSVTTDHDATGAPPRGRPGAMPTIPHPWPTDPTADNSPRPCKSATASRALPGGGASPLLICCGCQEPDASRRQRVRVPLAVL